METTSIAVEVVAAAESITAEPIVAAVQAEVPATTGTSSSNSGSIAIVFIVLACIVGGLLQSFESSAAPSVPTVVSSSPSPVASSSNSRRSGTIRTPAAATAPISASSSTSANIPASTISPFSWNSVSSPAAAPVSLLAGPKRVSLSPIHPVRKIHFSPVSMGLSDPATPAPFGEGLSHRLDNVNNTVQAMRASIEKATAAAAASAARATIRAPAASRSLAAASSSTASLPVFGEFAATSAAAAVVAPTTASKRIVRARASTVAHAAPVVETATIPDRRVTRRSSRLA